MNTIPKKNKGLILFELETTQQFPITELYLALTFFLILIYITVGGSTLITTNSIENLPNVSELNFRVLQPFLLELPLMLNGIFLSLLISNSYTSHESKIVMVNILSLPISRIHVFLFKYLYYFILSLFVCSSSIIMAFFLHSLNFNLEFIFLVFIIFTINILFSLFLGIFFSGIVNHNTFGNILIILFWLLKDLILKKPLYDTLPDFLTNIFFPNNLLLSYQNELLVSDLTITSIGLIIVIIAKIMFLNLFIRKDITND